jgi:hypothetical protein
MLVENAWEVNCGEDQRTIVLPHRFVIFVGVAESNQMVG